jgi:hypothetical protein
VLRDAIDQIHNSHYASEFKPGRLGYSDSMLIPDLGDFVQARAAQTSMDKEPSPVFRASRSVFDILIAVHDQPSPGLLDCDGL